MGNEELSDIHRVIGLIQEDLSNQITADDKIELEEWLAQAPARRKLYSRLQNPAYRNEVLKEWDPKTADASLAKVRSAIALENRLKLWPKLLIAACLLIFASIGLYFVALRSSQAPLTVKNKIIPGSNKAILTLASGKKIVLTNLRNGILANQANVQISKSTAGQLTYLEKKDFPAKLAYDTLTTPRGGMYHILLADGTGVWLNASTTIRFPENFNNKARTVELINGEAYFEVFHRKDLPFRVTTASSTVEDIGTHFNINSYQDEPWEKTTLIAGAVTVYSGRHQVNLLPGQQAAISPNPSGAGYPITVHSIEADEAIAWKNGSFVFDDADIHTIMRQIARWYDVDVSFAANLPTDDFGGTVSRYSDVNDVLRKLELTNKVHFKVIGRRILVSR